MFRFDPSKMSVVRHAIKIVTTALGGSVTVSTIDEDGKEQLDRILVPMAVARAFAKRVGHTRFLVPFPVYMLMYDNQVVALEEHPLVTLQAELPANWKPYLVKGMDYIASSITQGDWYFDGRYVYQYQTDVNDPTNVPLDHSGQFRAMRVNSIDLYVLHAPTSWTVAQRDCVAYVASSGKFAISPPIWKSIRDVGSAVEGGDDEQSARVADEEADRFYIDDVNGRKKVNLNFALKAGNTLSELFGYQTLEPLGLADLMIDLRTVNLPALPKSVKQTYAISLEFKHAFAWLLGLLGRSNQLDTYIAMRSLIKYLGTRGLQESSSVKQYNILIDGESFDDMPLHTVDDLNQRFKSSPIRNALVTGLIG